MNGESVVHRAVRLSHFQCLRFLVHEDLSSRDEYGCTPLHDASVLADPSCAEILLEQHVNVAVKDAKGYTCLHRAAERGKARVISLILKKAEHRERIINKKTDAGETALLLAAAQGRKEAMLLLLHHGAALDLQDNTGRTAAHWACIRNRIACADLLVCHGAHFGIRDLNDNTAWDFLDAAVKRQFVQRKMPPSLVYYSSLHADPLLSSRKLCVWPRGWCIHCDERSAL